MKINKEVYQKQLKWFAPGESIFREGDVGVDMFIIIEGRIEIRKQTSLESSKTLTNFSKGDIFGEMALIEKKARSASALATEKTHLLVLNENLFESMIVNNPDFAWKMIKVLSERIRRTNATLQSVLANNLQNQLYSGLSQYAEEFGVNTFKGKRLNRQKFIKWACEHLGYGVKEIEQSLPYFITKGLLEISALGNEEFIFRGSVAP